MEKPQGASQSPKYLAGLTVGALGVVYGDIGTSPLYAFREAFAVADLEVTQSSVLGVLSLIFWALVLVVTIKYLTFVLRADSDGEGGILALTSLVMRKAGGAGKPMLLIFIGLFGTALLYGDGMITPAISVLSAVEGLEVAVPALASWVQVIAAIILIILFTNQHRGTSVLGSLFGPIMIVWFSVLALLGILQIVDEPSVLAAINPFEALQFVIAEPGFAFLALGGIFLVVTGSEALYADMGHFGARPIRMGWFAVVFPALVLNYFGQGALLLNHPEDIENPFYALAPSWGVLPLVLLATMATVIASQALISGAYSLTSQAIQLSFLPRQRIDHTSPDEIGQIYMPTINYLLMVAAVALVFGFGSSTNLAAAYGVGVAMDMVITTILLSVVMKVRWNWSVSRVVSLTALFLVADLVFFGANITKIPSGGWFPLVIATVGFVLMVTWNKGRELMAMRMKSADIPIERFVESVVESDQQRVEGTSVYLHSQAGGTPPSLVTNLRHHGVLHESIIIVSVETVRRAHVPGARRATVDDLGDGFVQVVLRYGFLDRPDIPVSLSNIVKANFGFDPTAATYFIGRETILPTELPGMWLWREHLFAFMHRNASSAARFFALPAEQVVEVGIQVPI